MRKLILTNFQSPGDLVMLTAAIRDLHLTYPGQFQTDVRTRCPQLWENNPFITPLQSHEEDVETIECEYPLIHRSNQEPWHFLHGFIDFLNQRLGLNIKPTAFKGDIHLSPTEKSWMSQVQEITRDPIPFWIVNAGGKLDYTIKWWDPARYQAVVDHFRDQILFVQVGESGHNHPALDGVLDLRGKTDLRQLIRLVYHAQGVLGPVSLLMHLAAAVEVKPGIPKNRPCVVVAGGREPPHWEAYPHHQFIHTVGALHCCDDGGCWKSRTVPLGDGDEKDRPENLCVDVVGTLPRCMDMITTSAVIHSISIYFSGGSVQYINAGSVASAPALTADNARLLGEDHIRRIPPYPDSYHGCGIVICAGGRQYFTSAWICIRMLRRLGCGLPIEIWHLGPTELDARMADLVRPYGVRCIDALEVRRRVPARILNGWELKPYAILNSSFQKVLLLDADNLPLVNPTFLIESSEFAATGAIFWPDRGEIPRCAPIWDICGVPYRKGPEFESGQLLVDKSVCWPALSLAMWYNERSDFFYQYIHGDKDTFQLAFRKLDTPWMMPPYPVSCRNGVFVQHDFAGRPIFQHQQKWDLFDGDRLREGLEYQPECLGFLEELRRQWNGRIGQDNRSPIAPTTDRQLAVYRTLTENAFVYHRVGYDHRPMTFRPDGRVGQGIAEQETYWEIQDAGDSLFLDLLANDHSLTCRLRPDAEGTWRGRWVRFERMPVELALQGR